MYQKHLTSSFLVLTAVLALACGSGKTGIPGIEDFTVSVLQQRLYVAFLATRIHWDTGITVPIPGLGDATLSAGPHLSSDGTVFQFQVGLGTIVNDGQPLPFSPLPDGRAIPDVNGGQMPRWDFDVSNLTLSLYLSTDAFGVFVPIDLTGLSSLVSIFIEDEKGNRLGKAYAIPPNPQVQPNVSGNGSGVLVLLPFVFNPKGVSSETQSIPL